MKRFHLSLFFIGIFSLLASLGAQADTTTTVVEKRTIVTPAPKATCTTVPGQWQDNVWIDTHNVCKYENRSEGVAWISDYWSCTDASADGACTTWTLVPGHWVKTLQ